MTKCPSVCTSHCVFAPCIMKVNNAFDTDLMLLASDFFLQTGGVKAKPQVVFLRRNVLVCDWQQNSKDLSRYRLFTLLTGKQRWENKQQAFLGHRRGARDNEAGAHVAESGGKTVPPEQSGKCWSLASRNPTQVWLAFLTRREQWRNERSFSLDQKEALLLPFWAATQRPELNGWWWADNSKGDIPGHPNMLGLDQRKAEH